MSVTLRRATDGDIEQLAPLFDDYRQFYLQPPDLARARSFLCERLLASQSVIFIALDDRSSLVGFTQLYPGFSSVRTARVWVLNDLFVVPGARRSGVAENLVRTAADFAGADGAVRITLSSGVSNHAAHSLYERLGWQRESGFVEFALDL